jgi:hypothetical protein
MCRLNDHTTSIIDLITQNRTKTAWDVSGMKEMVESKEFRM